MKIYKAYELLSMLNCLTLVGQDSDGDLEWAGTTTQWGAVDVEEERILREHYEGIKWHEHE